MAFSSIRELVAQCEREGKGVSEVMLEREVNRSGKSREVIFQKMKTRFLKMEEAVRKGISSKENSPSGISGGDASLFSMYREKRSPMSGDYISDAMRFAMATSETNAKMGVIVATPTAGSCGILPGCLFSLRENGGHTADELTMGLFTASAIGYVIANRAFISGSAGGCQAEVGSAVAMAAATIVELKGGSPEQSAQAAAMALKSLLGLVCDPVAGLVEVPCVKRNVIGTAIAFSAADLALAGIKSRIPCDEVIDAMYDIGKSMPHTLKETALGGLAATPTGERVKRQLFGADQESVLQGKAPCSR